jgi:excisionase family DNA binding protein
MGVYMLPFYVNNSQIAFGESGMNQMLSAVEAAKVLGVSAWTIRQWSSQRKLRFYKVGRLTKYKVSDLEAFLEQGKAEANPAA